MSESRLVSPNEMHKAACDMMLDGRPPTTEMDWVRVVNFYAVNTHESIAQEAVPFLCMLMGCPLTREQIDAIVVAQLLSKMGITVEGMMADHDTRNREG